MFLSLKIVYFLRYLFMVFSINIIVGLWTQIANAELQLSLEPLAKEYILGEPVKLKVTLQNLSTNEPIQLTSHLNPFYGNLLLYISRDGKAFKNYLGPGWGIGDHFVKPKYLAPGKHESYVLSVLWNHTIAGEDDSIDTALAFPEQGRYWLSVKLLIDEKHALNSNIIDILINNPVGNDAAIWEILNKNHRLVRYIQYPKAKISSEHIRQLEALLKKHPNSTYAPYLKPASPSRPVKKETIIKEQLRRDIFKVIDDYFYFYEQKDMEAIKSYLDESFLYNDALDRNVFGVKLKEEFEKLEKLDKTVSITREVRQLEMIEGKPTVEVLISYFLDGEALSQPKLVQVKLNQKSGKWLLESWKDIKMKFPIRE